MALDSWSAASLARPMRSALLKGGRLNACLVTTRFFVVLRIRTGKLESRRLPGMTQRLAALQVREINLPANRIAVQKIAPGRSREPPVATRFGRTNDRNDDMGHRTQAKAAPLHGSDRIGLASEAARSMVSTANPFTVPPSAPF